MTSDSDQIEKTCSSFKLRKLQRMLLQNCYPAILKKKYIKNITWCNSKNVRTITENLVLTYFAINQSEASFAINQLASLSLGEQTF